MLTNAGTINDTNGRRPVHAKYIIESSSTLFSEAWSMYVAWLSSVATICLPAQRASAGRVMAMVAAKAATLGPPGPTDGPLRVDANFLGFPERLRLKDEQGDVLVVRDAGVLLDKISLPNQQPPNELVFEVVGAEAPDGTETYEQPQSHSHELPNRYLADLWGYIIGGAYERNYHIIERRHGGWKSSLQSWPPELQLFHHVRNATFHGGTFKIWANKIDPANAPSWESYTIPDESAVNGLHAIGDFMAMAHVLPFVHAVSVALDDAVSP